MRGDYFMKRILALAAITCGMAFGQASPQGADACTPSAYNVPGAKYPCVYSDNRAMFRVIAPNAQKVTLRIGQ